MTGNDHHNNPLTRAAVREIARAEKDRLHVADVRSMILIRLAYIVRAMAPPDDQREIDRLLALLEDAERGDFRLLPDN